MSLQAPRTLGDKKMELDDFMSSDLKKRSQSGYSISDGLRKKWNALGPLTVEMITQYLVDW